MKDMKLAPLPKVEFSEKDAAGMLSSSIKILNHFSYEVLKAKTLEESETAIHDFVEHYTMQSKVIELLLSECSVEYIANGFFK